MVKSIIFRFISGFGNRLCNLINMMYLHDKFPKADIYVEWLTNNHCNVSLDIIIEKNQFHYIKFNYPYKGGEIFASTSNTSRTKWDCINNWENQDVVVSVSFYMYLFVPYKNAIQYFSTIRFSNHINDLVQMKINKYGKDKPLIHFRGGDLLKCIEYNETIPNISENLRNIVECIKQQKKCQVYSYDEMIVNRTSNDISNAIADLIYISKYNRVIAYSPYSHFSSWIFLLSDKFIDNPETFPIFNYKKTTIICTE
jgi:hypothetical protein